jgi:hypothetical protein
VPSWSWQFLGPVPVMAVAQIYNPDPFARPVFRAPVYQTPAGLILLACLARLLYRLARLASQPGSAAGSRILSS